MNERESEECSCEAQSEWSTSLVGKRGNIYSVSSNMVIVVQVNGQAGHPG